MNESQMVTYTAIILTMMRHCHYDYDYDDEISRGGMDNTLKGRDVWTSLTPYYSMANELITYIRYRLMLRSITWRAHDVIVLKSIATRS